MENTKIFLNTWGAYNNGSIGFGWFEPQEALDFMESSLKDDNFVAKNGEEFFIADIDNYLGFDFGNLEYANIEEVCETIETLEGMEEYEKDAIIAILEHKGSNNILEAIEDMDSYIIYASVDDYFDCCDESIDFKGNDFMERYFDFEAYHRDCLYDAYEASNGVVLVS